MTRPVAVLPHPTSEVVTAVRNILVMSREWYSRLLAIVDRVPVTGTATFAAATTVAVTFASPELSTDYMIVVEPAANRTYWPSSKTVTGFTLNASASNSDTVNWALLRT